MFRVKDVVSTLQEKALPQKVLDNLTFFLNRNQVAGHSYLFFWSENFNIIPLFGGYQSSQNIDVYTIYQYPCGSLIFKRYGCIYYALTIKNENYLFIRDILTCNQDNLFVHK
jgi:hypothetical protein